MGRHCAASGRLSHPNAAGDQTRKTASRSAVSGATQAPCRRGRTLTDAYDHLGSFLPCYPPDKKMTKIETLRLAMMYIKDLRDVVQDLNEADDSLTTSTASADFDAAATASPSADVSLRTPTSTLGERTFMNDCGSERSKTGSPSLAMRSSSSSLLDIQRAASVASSTTSDTSSSLAVQNRPSPQRPSPTTAPAPTARLPCQMQSRHHSPTTAGASSGTVTSGHFEQHTQPLRHVQPVRCLSTSYQPNVSTLHTPPCCNSTGSQLLPQQSPLTNLPLNYAASDALDERRFCSPRTQPSFRLDEAEMTHYQTPFTPASRPFAPDLLSCSSPSPVYKREAFPCGFDSAGTSALGMSHVWSPHNHAMQSLHHPGFGSTLHAH